MNLREVFFYAFIIFSVGVVTYFAFYSEEGHFAPPAGYLSLDSPLNCTEQRIKEMWSNVLVEEDNGLTIFNKTVNGTCVSYVAFQTSATRLQYLVGYYSSYSYVSGSRFYTVNSSEITTNSFNFTGSSFYGVVQPNITRIQNFSDFENFLENTFFDYPYNYLEPRNIHNVSEANATLSSVFYFEYGSSWDKYVFSDETIYSFDILTIINGANVTTNYARSGHVLGNHTYDSLDYSVDSESWKAISCMPSWRQVNSTCNNATETFVSYYYDLNSCNSSANYPGNATVGCDYNRNGIIGTISDVEKSNINVDLYVDGNKVNFTNGVNYTTDKTVNFREGNVTRVSFDYDFSVRPLNLKDVEIKKQSSSSDYGYLIVNGIDEEKTVRVDKLTDTEAVCVKDAEVSGVGSISDDCTDSGEYYIECPGENDDFECTLSSSPVLVVSGLDHSGVREMEELNDDPNNNDGPSRCVQSWSCLTWGACVNNLRTMNCVDLNNCGNLTGKPVITEACSSCTPDWECEWLPEICPENETQAYSCFDVNNCGNDAGKPTNSRDCTYQKPKTWVVFAIIGLATLILCLVFVLIIVLRRYNSE